jgi:hypothetical protein
VLHGTNYIVLPPEMMMPPESSEHDLINWVFGDLKAHFPSAQNPSRTEYARYVSSKAVLAPTVIATRILNDTISSQYVPGDCIIHSRSFDTLLDPQCPNAHLYPPDILHSMWPSGFPPHILRLKRGDTVMVLRNLDDDLLNGTRCLVMQATTRVLTVMIASGERLGQVRMIPRIKFIDERLESGLPVVFTRTQFPVILAWAMTVNKAQGQSLLKMGLFLPTQLFSHGMLYVALSRCPAMSCLKVLSKKVIRGASVVRNVVFKELLT